MQRITGTDNGTHGVRGKPIPRFNVMQPAGDQYVPYVIQVPGAGVAGSIRGMGIREGEKTKTTTTEKSFRNRVADRIDAVADHFFAVTGVRIAGIIGFGALAYWGYEIAHSTTWGTIGVIGIVALGLFLHSELLWEMAYRLREKPSKLQEMGRVKE